MVTTPSRRTPRKASTPSRLPLGGASRLLASLTPSRMGTPSRMPRGPTPSRTRTSMSTTPAATFTDSSSTPSVALKSSSEEGITVAIRMRPLNSKESSDESSGSETARRIWRVLPQYHSVAQTTPSGQPLAERVMNRNFFTFDKVFGEDTSTAQIYDGVAKPIVDSVVNGLNGTIFCYGQTSSGKTFTMQGSGSIKEGSSGTGGVVHMAAKNIFDHITSESHRVFLVRVSFLEIYNEEVRDLLGNNEVLQIREDPRRGVFTNSVEEIVTDMEGLLEILFTGERRRAVAATGMNERSSRSHTIFKITIESRAGEDSEDEDGEDGAVRISTLNLVDLAGSESVRHTGNTGDRLKEGAKINTSLLTLSRVIVALGQSNQTHINFRDSRLTRILQPSLSGNARMAVICCATPSDLYLEETRSTLMFASRAKLVKTNAQVNEVLDDRSLIKRLQRELAEAKKQFGGQGGNTDELLALEQKAAHEGKERREAEEKLLRLQKSILNSKNLFQTAGTKMVAAISAQHRKRRLSDGVLKLKTNYETPAKQTRLRSPKSASDAANKERPDIVMEELSPRTELNLVRQAVVAKGVQQRILQEDVEEKSRIIEMTEMNLERMLTEKAGLVEDLQAAQDQCKESIAGLEELQKRFDVQEAEKDNAIQRAKELEFEFKSWKQHSKDMMSALEVEKSNLQTSLQHQVSQKESSIKELTAKCESQAAVMETMELDLADALTDRKTHSDENVRIAFELAQLNSEKDKIITDRDQDKQKIQHLSGEVSLLMATMKDSSEEKQALKDEVAELKEEIRSRIADREAVQEQVTVLTKSVEEHEQSLAQARIELDQKTSTVSELEVMLAEAKDGESNLSSWGEELQERVATIEAAKHVLHSDLAQVTSEKEELQCSLDAAHTACTNMQSQLDSTIEDLRSNESAVAHLTKSLEASNEDRTSQLETIRELECKNVTVLSDFEKLEDETKALTQDLTTRTAEVTALTTTVEEVTASFNESTKALEASKSEIGSHLATIQQMEHDKECALSNIADLSLERDSLLSQLGTKSEEVIALTTSMEEAAASFNCVSKALEASTSEIESNLSTIQRLEQDKDSALSRIDDLSSERDSLLSQLGTKSEEMNTLTTTVEDVTVSFNNVTKALEASKSEIESHLSTIQQLEQDKESEFSRSDELSSERDSLHSQLNTTLEKVSRLTSSLDDMKASSDRTTQALQVAQQKVDDLEQSNLSLKEEIQSYVDSGKSSKLLHTEAIETRDNEIISLKSDISDMRVALSEAESQNETSSAQASELETALESEKRTSSDLEDKIIAVTAEKDALTSEINDLKSNVEQLEAWVQDVTEKATAIEEEKFQLSDELETSKKLSSDSLVQVEQLRDSVSVLQMQVDEYKSTLDLLTCEKVAVEENAATENEKRLAELDELKKSHQEIVLCRDAELSSLESELAKVKAANDTILAQQTKVTNDLEESISQLESEKAALTSQIEILASEKAAAISTNEDLQNDIAASTQVSETLVTDLGTTRSELNNARVEISNLEAQMIVLRDQSQLAQSTLEGQKTDLSLKLSALMTERDTLHQQLKANTNDVQKTSVEQQLKIDELKQHQKDLNNELQQKTNEAAALLSSRDDLSSRVTELEQQLSDLSAILEESKQNGMQLQESLQSSKKELDSSLRSKEEKIAALEEQVEQLSYKLSQSQEELMESHQSTSEHRSKTETEIDALKAELLSTSVSLEEARAVVADLRAKANTTSEEVERHRSTAMQLQTELASSQQALETAIASKSKLENELDYSQSSLAALTMEKDQLTEKLQQAHQSTIDSDEVAALRSAREALEEDNRNLAQLLSQANASVKEAREAALAADDELSQKELTLEHITHQLSAREEELESTIERVSEQEKRISLLEQETNTGELQEEMQQLFDEKLKLESKLESERIDRQAWEEEHKRVMGDEQRQLIQEAENKMSEVRVERDQIRSALSQSETEIYSLKQERDEFVDENRRLETKISESQSALSILEQEKGQLKSTIFDLTVAQKELTAKMAKLERQDDRSDEEVAMVSAELNRVRAESHEAKEHALDLKEKVRQLEHQNTRLQKEAASNHEKRMSLESSLPELEAEIQLLQQQVQSFQEQSHSTEATVAEITKLKQEIKDRDGRIKKLEKVKLTREQVNALKKIKVERAQFEKENSSLRRQLEKVQDEIDALKSSYQSSSSGLKAGQDLATMTFEKQALETKLRKYVAHCKALENDKAQIVDTLRVRKRAVVDDDFAGAVVSLCDELTSLEKECDSHSTTANRTSSDSAQMEKLREEFSSVKSERNDFQSKVLRLTRSEGELSSKVQRLESKVAVLREERDKLRSHVNGGVSEKSRQVKFLEEENLKLITELKSTKKQLNTARTEIESFKMNGLGVDDTEDFSNFHLNNKPKTATGALPMTPEHKENKPNIFSTSKKKSVSASTKKRRTLGRSAHKQRPVGLGEAAPDDDMNTQECRQS